MKENNLFRKEAIQELTSPEQLDQLIQVVTPRAWIIAYTVYAIILCLIIWLFLGSIPTQADSYGILLAGGGDIYSAVAPDGPSRLENFLVKPGDKVTQGQPVAVLSRPDLTSQIQTTQKYLIDLIQKYKQLQTDAQQQIAIRQKQTTEQQQAAQNTIDNAQIKAKNLEELLRIREAAFQQGIETRQNVTQTTQEYYSTKNEIETASSQIVQLQAAQDSFVSQWREQLRSLEMKMIDENLKYTDMQSRLKLSSQVTAPVTGVVTHLPIATGSIANTGAPLVSIASNGKGLDALVYLPPQLGKQVKVGMRAKVAPTTVEKAEFGSIYGKVIDVAPFPATPEAIHAILQNDDLVKRFTQKEPPIQVRIRLENNPETYSGLKWSSSQGPQQIITPGTLATAMITVRQQPPITLLIPAFKKLMGVE